MANGDPMISRKFADNPFAAKAAETAILLPSKWSSKRFGEGGVVYVGHASLYSQRKPSASLDVAGKYRTGQRADRKQYRSCQRIIPMHNVYISYA